MPLKLLPLNSDRKKKTSKQERKRRRRRMTSLMLMWTIWKVWGMSLKIETMMFKTWKRTQKSKCLSVYMLLEP